MNDLRTLGAALAQDEPAQDVVDRSRHRLQNHMRGARPIRRRVWLALIAATAAAAVVVALPAGDPPPLTGQDILLAAATAAERSPEGSGTYWYYKVESDSFSYEYWVKPDGQYWFRYADGEVQQMPDRLRHPFSLIGVPLTLDQLRALPTDPDELRAWIADAVEDDNANDPLSERDTLDSLISLVSMLPAPPEVRAAAFRAIAAYPGVQNLGDVPGGKGVLLPDDGLLAVISRPDGQPAGQRLVVDPATGRANGTSFYVSMGGERHILGSPDARITAEWTDSLP